MNTNEREHVPSEESRVHTLLCAYVLGEATDGEKVEVEQLLEASAELRAERERLEVTIGLVQTTMGSADALPAESSNVLTAALAAKSRQRWYQLPVARMAAAAGVLGLAYAGWRTAMPEVDTAAFTYTIFDDVDDTVARAPKSAPALEVAGHTVPLSEEELDQLSKLGYAENDDRSFRRGEKKERANESAADALRGLGYIDTEIGGKDEKRDSGGEVAAGIEAEEPAEGVLGEDFSIDPNVRTRQELGLGEVAAASASGRLVKLQEDSGSFRGPGNTVPPVGTSGGAAPHSRGKAGPASPGPASPGGAPARQSRKLQDAPVAGSNDFFLGRGAATQREGEVTGETLERLEKLGYVEKDDDGQVSLGGLTAARTDLTSGGRYGGRSGEQARLRRRIEFILNSCTRRPNERPRDMFFRFWGDNPFEWTAIDTLSTFSVDVDTASYALARRYLTENRLPTKEQVRTEEFVNYFDSDVPAPVEGTFAIHTELAPNRFGDGPDSWMLRVAVRGKDVTREERQPLTLTFVVDVSGSMKENHRMELVKHALRLLVGELDARDSISLVAFSKEARLILPMTSAKHRSLIETAIHQLQPDGGTNAEAGLLMGYEQAAAFLAENTHNRVVLLSDGVANIGHTDQETLTRNVERHRKSGIYLNTVGVGMNNHNDNLLEQLANKGDGICNYVDDEVEARRALVERFTGAFEPIARDVKIQVEFDPRQVERYRLLGYENRAIADVDFRNDEVDAGEVNAGHQVVALYELVGTTSSDAGPLATVRLRWKPPHLRGVANVETDAATETAQPVSWAGAASQFRSASKGYRRSVLVAQFAEFLRRSTHARRDSLDQLIAEAVALDEQLDDDEFTEFVALAERSRQLVLAELNRYDDLERALDAIRHASYLQLQLEELNLRLGRDRLHELEVAVTRLAERIEWMRTLVAGDELAITRDELEALERENARLREQVRRLLEILLDPKRRVR